jgi:hypothetical protein
MRATLPRFDKTPALVGLLVIWVGLWFLPWQPLLKPLPALAVLIALAMYIVPGALLQQLAYPDRTFRPLRAITVGFTLSIPLTAILGLIALIFHLSIGFVLGSLFWISTVLLALLIRRGGWRTPAHIPSHRVDRYLKVLTAATIILSAALTFSNSTYENHVGDDETYDAFTQAYAYDNRLGFNEVFLGTDEHSSPRFWLALWPMSQAAITRLSGVHLLLVTPVLKTYFAVLALISLYELARALGLSNAVACLGVIGQMAWLYTFLIPEQYSFYTLNQDKRLLVAVVAPVIFRLLMEVFNDRRHIKIFAAVCLGASLTHITIFALTALICGIYCVGEILLFRRYKTPIQVIVVLAISIGIMLPMRFIERRYSFDVPGEGETIDVVTQDNGANRRVDRLNIIENTPFYGLGFQVFKKIPFLMMFASSAAALFFVRRSPAARFLVAFTLLVLLELFPFTGWIIGLGITPYHLWRISWMIPVAIGWAFLVSVTFGMLPKQPPPSKAGKSHEPLLAALGTLSFIVMIVFWLRDDGVKQQLARISQGQRPATGYETLAQLGEFLDQELNSTSIIMAEPARLSSMIPGLSHNAKTFLFRGNRIAAMQTNIDISELRRRDQLYRSFFDSLQSSEARIGILDEYGIELMVAEGDDIELTLLMQDYPERVIQIAQIGEYRVFRYSRAG